MPAHRKIHRNIPRIKQDAAKLSPASFAMVMATGVLSIALHACGQERAADALFLLNVLAWPTIAGLTLLRLALHRQHLVEDLISHRNGPAFLTTVAATAILGCQCVTLSHALNIAVALWVVSVTLFVALTYTIFAALTIKETKPTLDKGITGAWLLAVVATQSVSVLSALIAARIQQPWRLELNFCALSLWLWGGMLYIWMMSLIFYRYTFFQFLPSDLAPPYWINMGAMAISTLAGSLLILNAADAPFLASLLPFLKGFTVFYWATGTWWIPMLLILALWRYVYKRFPLRYDPLYWGAVFPLGMYSASTWQMARAMSLVFLRPVAMVFLVVGLLAWFAAAAGLVRHLVQYLRGRPLDADTSAPGLAD